MQTIKRFIPLACNLVVYPGIGTLITKRKTQGTLQILGATIALIWITYRIVVTSLILLQNYQSINETTKIVMDPAHIQLTTGLGTPTIIFLTIYLWAILTSFPKVKKEETP